MLKSEYMDLFFDRPTAIIVSVYCLLYLIFAGGVGVVPFAYRFLVGRHEGFQFQNP